MPRNDPAKLTKVAVSLPFGIGSAEWEADPTERRAAWSLYVELVTRIAVQQLESNEGIDREALTSLHSLFDTTREILREAGPDVGASKASVGGIAIAVLNQGLRPFLAKWHLELRTWETQSTTEILTKISEAEWPQRSEFHTELDQLRDKLSQYANALAHIAGV